MILENILKMNKEETQSSGPENKMLMKMLKTLHLSNDIVKLYVSWKERASELANIVDHMDASIQGPKDYI